VPASPNCIFFDAESSALLSEAELHAAKNRATKVIV
jgi:hypothetical protein